MNKYNFNNFKKEEAEESAYIIFDDSKENKIGHDDGNLFIEFEGRRYCFDLGQDISSIQYNKEANQILRELGIEGPKISGNNN